MAFCAECTYLNLEKIRDFGRFLCKKTYDAHLATDSECAKFCRAYRRDENTIKNAIDYSKSKTQKPPCYLTTMLCHILKLNDDNIYLNTFRNFRNNFLQTKEEYKQLLVEYDIIGPQIATALYNDPLRRKIADHHFNSYIIDIFYFIINENYDMAIEEYIKMTDSLKKIYIIDNIDISEIEIKNADIEKSGHGKYIQKKITL